MTHKRKRLGRPPGSKNKKNKNLESIIKTEGDSDECTHVCTTCSVSFNTKLSLEDHFKTCKKTACDGVDVLKPTYNCKQCPKKFQFKKSYTTHLQNSHSKTQDELWICPDVVKPTYNCKQCSKKFRFKKSYTTHLQNEHSKTPGSVECSQCSVKCPNEETLSKHIKNVHEREIFECEHCEKKFVRRSHVLRHLLQRGCDGRNVVVHPCEICSATFTRRDNLMVHLRTQHLSKEFFNCKYCDYHTRNFSKLVIHNFASHTESPHFECDHCGKVTSSRGAMAKHLEIHGEKKFSCEVCGYSTFTIEVMRRHVFTHLTEKPYKCNVCDSSYIQKVQLQRHLQKHTGNQCSLCDETFTSKANLLIHTKVHMGVNKLLCPIEGCSYGKAEFENADALQRHVKMHLENKPHQCEVCSKRFHSEMNMRRHMSTHALERPRRCMYCVAARAYVRGEQLVRHVRKAHPHVFHERLMHVRQVLGANLRTERVKKSELESILNVLDAESDRILEGYGSGVLYGGLQEQSDVEDEQIEVEETSRLMSEEELADNIGKLLSQLIDKDMLECFGWPDASIDEVLERVIENCGTQPADKEKWTRVQRLRENAKHLFLYVIEDKNIARMLDTHTIDQVITHILTQVSQSDDDDDDDDGDEKDKIKGNIKMK